MKKVLRNIALFSFFVFVIGVSLYISTKTDEVTSVRSESMSSSTVESLREKSDEDSKKDEIQQRQDIVRQQKLIVEETYLNEEKKRITDEKAKAVASFDAQTAEIEKKLEAVRTEKLSFE